MFNIVSIPTGPLAVNTYIVWYGEEGEPAECTVIDPANSNKVLRALAERQLTCRAILLTHGHFDHIMGVAKLRQETGAQVYINRLDAEAVSSDKASLASMVGIRVDPSKVDVFVEDGMEFTVAGIDFTAIHTPGHTKGGGCYIVEKERVIFSGDTLFRMSYGRTDLAGGDEAALYESLMYRLFTLKGDYRVLPGHEAETTLDFERLYNPCVRNGIME